VAKIPQLWPFNCYICTKLTKRMQQVIVYILGIVLAVWLIGRVVRYMRRPQPPRCNSCDDENCPLRNKER
jgi:hypothetical protein